MRAIADLMRGSTVERFESEQGPDGQPWKTSRRAASEGGKTLDRGRPEGLRLSITAASDDNTALAGTNKIYAAIHQFGFAGRQSVRPHERKITKAFGRKLETPLSVAVMAFNREMNLPARPYLGFSEVDKVEIETILSEHLAQALGIGG